MNPLDAVLHHPARLRIATRLVLFDWVRFARLGEMTGLTSGNLASHLANLAAAGYVEEKNAFIRARPGKIVRLTPVGRSRLQEYVQNLERLVAELRELPPFFEQSEKRP